MGERTSYPHGTFSWVDLTTSDPDAAKAFYGGLFGWEFEDLPTGEGRPPYSMARLGGKSVCALSPGDDGPPHWNSYVTVESVDDTAGRVGEAGGTLVGEPFDVMDVGRMAVVQDPTGAFLMLWEDRGNAGAERVNEPGCLTWNDLNTADPQAAMKFYERLLGWRFEPVAEDFPYWVIHNAERSNGGVREFSVEERESRIPAHWLPYFVAESLDGALERVQELGGHKVTEPIEVPNGGRFAAAQDPQGAFFAIYEGDVDD